MMRMDRQTEGNPQRTVEIDGRWGVIEKVDGVDQRMLLGRV